MELSAAQSKVPRHTRGGGHLLNLWGLPLESIPHTEQSAIWSKVPHHTRDGGHLLNLWGPPLESMGLPPESILQRKYSSLLLVPPGVSVISILIAY